VHVHDLLQLDTLDLTLLWGERRQLVREIGGVTATDPPDPRRPVPLHPHLAAVGPPADRLRTHSEQFRGLTDRVRGHPRTLGGRAWPPRAAPARTEHRTVINPVAETSPVLLR
jgi:hypothetical protein